MATNYALASFGSIASASSQANINGASYPVQAIINGDRTTGGQWNTGGGWASATAAPQSVVIDFGQSRPINRINVFSLRDSTQNTAPVTETETFVNFGNKDFRVERWDGTQFVTLASVVNNNLVWKTFTFAEVTTSKIRVFITRGGDSSVYLVEVEAVGPDPVKTAPVINQQVDNWVSKNGLLAWYKPELLGNLANGQGVSFWSDASGNGRTLTPVVTGSDVAPFAQTNALNGYRSVVFNNQTTPLVLQRFETLSVKTAIVIASNASAVFTSFEGLLTDVSTIPVFVGEQGASRFTNFLNNSANGYNYRFAGTSYAESNQIAPMSNKFGLVYATLETGFGLTSMQIGQDRATKTRRWNGRIIEVLIYDRVLTDCERYKMQEYISAKYQLWERTAAGLDVLPFPGTWGEKISRKKIVATYKPVVGNKIKRVKRGAKLEAPFTAADRPTSELDAMRAFWDLHCPLEAVLFRNYALIPPRETTVDFGDDAEFTESSEGVNLNSYSFNMREI